MWRALSTGAFASAFGFLFFYGPFGPAAALAALPSAVCAFVLSWPFRPYLNQRLVRSLVFIVPILILIAYFWGHSGAEPVNPRECML
jgi:hypothetical protein